MRIRIMGNSASGKTTLSRYLGEVYNINVLHLDSLNFKENWIENDINDFKNKLDTFLSKNKHWIIEGNYKSRTLELNKICDIVIFIDLAVEQSIENAYKRQEKYKGKCREELPGCVEKIDDEFLEWIKSYEVRRPEFLDYFEGIRKSNQQVKFIHITSMKELNELYNNINQLKEKNE